MAHIDSVSRSVARSTAADARYWAPIFLVFACCAMMSTLCLAAGPASGAATRSPAASASVVDHLNVPGPIPFQGKSYRLAWSERKGVLTVQEYLPAGETLERFDSMFTINERTDVSVEIAAAAKIRELEARKGTDPVVNHAMLRSEDGRRILLDLLLSVPDGNGGLIVEWSAYRYEPRREGDGVRMVGISRRAYGDAVVPFLRDALKRIRVSDVDALAAQAVSDPAPANKSPDAPKPAKRDPVQSPDR